VIKDEIDRPKMTDLSHLAFWKPAYPALTPVNLGQTGEPLVAVTKHKAHGFHGVGAAQGAKCICPEYQMSASSAPDPGPPQVPCPRAFDRSPVPLMITH
jgi:hypothetical protein